MTDDDRLTPESWLKILASAYTLFDDAERRGFGTPPFSLGGGTVLMLEFQHRLSKDIDFFGYDAQWISVLSPRLNHAAAELALTYSEQANVVKIVMAQGDIDFIVAGDATSPVQRSRRTIAGRTIEIEPCAEILAKKLLFRAAAFLPRDVYDMSAAIDLDPPAAATAALAARSKKDVLLRRLDELGSLDQHALLDGIVPYGDDLAHGEGMIGKVREFIVATTDGGRSP